MSPCPCSESRDRGFFHAFAAGGNGLPGMPDKEARCPADIGAEAQERFRRLGKEQEHGKRNTLQDLSG